MKKGDFVRVSYSGWLGENLIETTDEDLAKKEGIYSKGRRYGPTVVVVGEGMILPGIDKGLETMKLGEKKRFKLSPSDAYGERSFKLIQLVPMRDFRKQKITPMPGMILEIEGRPARIQSVTSGRVRVDFNHPLAGKELEYEVKVEGVAKNETEKIAFLIERNFRQNLKHRKDGKKLTITVPVELSMSQMYPVMQAVFKVEAKKFLGVDDVVFEKEGESKGEIKSEKRTTKGTTKRRGEGRKASKSSTKRNKQTTGK